MTIKKIRYVSDKDEVEIPPQLQQELDAMNAAWREEVQAQDEDGQFEEQIDVDPTDYDDLPGEQPETDLAEYRLEVLGKAAHIVTRDRNITYGEPEDNFKRISQMWSAYLGMDLLPTDVAAMMVILKIGRLAVNPTHEDSWVDVAGFAACGASTALTLRPVESMPEDNQ